MIEAINIMAYYECAYKDDHINIGDKFNVSLTGSHNKSTTATVCYIYKGDKTTVCLLCNTGFGSIAWSTACAYAWNYTVNINNNKYTGMCKIPTLEQITSKCAGYKRDFSYWTSTPYNSSYHWYVSSSIVFYTSDLDKFDSLPFIEITL